MAEANKLAKMASELNTLKQKLASSTSAAKPKNKKKGRGNQSRPYQDSTLASSTSSGSTITVTRMEMVIDVKTDANGLQSGNLSLKPSGTSLPWLNKLTDAFCFAEWKSISLFWKPGVSANTDGRIAFALDLDGRTESPASRSTVLLYSPVKDTQIWQDTQQKPIVYSGSFLMGQKKFQTSSAAGISPGSLIYWCTGPKSQQVGELWISYKVTLSGPR
nr:MAG: capsid protein [Spider permutotetra-like virus]